MVDQNYSVRRIFNSSATLRQVAKSSPCVFGLVTRKGDTPTLKLDFVLALK